MLTLSAQLRAMRQGSSFGEFGPHRFGGPESRRRERSLPPPDVVDGETGKDAVPGTEVVIIAVGEVLPLALVDMVVRHDVVMVVLAASPKFAALDDVGDLRQLLAEELATISTTKPKQVPNWVAFNQAPRGWRKPKGGQCAPRKHYGHKS